MASQRPHTLAPCESCKTDDQHSHFIVQRARAFKGVIAVCYIRGNLLLLLLCGAAVCEMLHFFISAAHGSEN
jgi:hypothetical protein